MRAKPAARRWKRQLRATEHRRGLGRRRLQRQRRIHRHQRGDLARRHLRREVDIHRLLGRVVTEQRRNRQRACFEVFGRVMRRLDAEQPKRGLQTVLMAVDISVDSADERVHLRAHLGRIGRGTVACEFLGIEQPIDVIAFDQVGAKHFGQTALRQPPAHLELEQPILRLRVAQRPREVEPVLGVDMRHAGRVANHLDRRNQPVEFDDPRLRREPALGNLVEQARHHGHKNERDHESDHRASACARRTIKTAPGTFAWMLRHRVTVDRRRRVRASLTGHRRRRRPCARPSGRPG